MELQEVIDARDSLSKAFDTFKDYATQNEDKEIAALSVVNANGETLVAITGNAGTVVETLIRSMANNPSLRQTMQAAVKGYGMFGFMFKSDNECDCASCVAERENKHES